MMSRLRREESGRDFAARNQVATSPRGIRSRLRRKRLGTRVEVAASPREVRDKGCCEAVQRWLCRCTRCLGFLPMHSFEVLARPQRYLRTRGAAELVPNLFSRRAASPVPNLFPRRGASRSSSGAQPRSSPTPTSICDAQRRPLTPASPAPSRCSRI